LKLDFEVANEKEEVTEDFLTPFSVTKQTPRITVVGVLMARPSTPVR
jgi:hypothetical protein